MQSHLLTVIDDQGLSHLIAKIRKRGSHRCPKILSSLLNWISVCWTLHVAFHCSFHCLRCEALPILSSINIAAQQIVLWHHLQLLLFGFCILVLSFYCDYFPAIPECIVTKPEAERCLTFSQTLFLTLVRSCWKDSRERDEDVGLRSRI